MIFFTHPLFTSSFSFSSDGGVAKTVSPTVNRWTFGTCKLIFCRLYTDHGRGKACVALSAFQAVFGLLWHMTIRQLAF